VVLAEKVIDMAMLESLISKIDRKELKFKFAKKLCNEGKGSEFDLKKAFSIFEDLSKQNHIDGEICYSCCFQKGYGCIKNEEKGNVILEYCALKGSARAQRRLGGCYYDKKNYQKAVEWYTKAAEQGNASSQYSLGICYYKGYGVEKDYQKAVEWWTKAAEQGNASAQNNLGICYYNGYGVEKDYQKAVEWYTKAAEQENASAQYSLGYCYKNGKGVKQDYSKALELYTKAAEQRNFVAMLGLHLMKSGIQNSIL